MCLLAEHTLHFGLEVWVELFRLQPTAGWTCTSLGCGILGEIIVKAPET